MVQESIFLAGSEDPLRFVRYVLFKNLLAYMAIPRFKPLAISIIQG
jgi:hypothetical protein